MAKKMRFISDEDQIKITKAASVFYDQNGNVTENAKLAFAKTEMYEDKLYHYVLRDGFHLVNIVDGSYNQNKSKWSMSMINKECFEAYILFLKTKKTPYFTNAERLSHGNSR